MELTALQALPVREESEESGERREIRVTSVHKESEERGARRVREANKDLLVRLAPWVVLAFLAMMVLLA
jgi:hypothetical protein